MLVTSCKDTLNVFFTDVVSELNGQIYILIAKRVKNMSLNPLFRHSVWHDNLSRITNSSSAITVESPNQYGQDVGSRGRHSRDEGAYRNIILEYEGITGFGHLSLGDREI